MEGKLEERIKKYRQRVTEFITAHRNAIKIWVFVLITAGLLFKGIIQQPQIAENRKQIQTIKEQIEYEKLRQQEIEELKTKVNTDEYIEKMASEKLGLVKSNAKIFVDVSQEQ